MDGHLARFQFRNENFDQGQGNQAIARIDAEIGQKGHLWMGTILIAG
jgi:hypothetical protein